MSKIIGNVPVEGARQALQDFRTLAATLGPAPKGTDARHIIRLLKGAHHPEVRGTLRFLDDSAAAWPALVKKLLQHTSESQFRQTLAELRVLSHLNQQPGVHAQPAHTPKNSKHHDIDATAAGVAAKIEIYSPSDVIGPPLIDQHISPLFKFLEVPVGFHLDLTLEPLAKDDVNHTSDVGTASQIARWLPRIRTDAEMWINASTVAGASKSWDGPNKAVRLTAVIRKISEDRTDRRMRYLSGTLSTDGSALFDQGDPRELRFSPWGKKVFDKMRERQCGDYEPSKARLLVVDFAGFGAGGNVAFKTINAEIFARIRSALQMAAAHTDASMPYDGVVLAWIEEPIAFAPLIELDSRATAELKHFFSEATLTGTVVRSV